MSMSLPFIACLLIDDVVESYVSGTITVTVGANVICSTEMCQVANLVTVVYYDIANIHERTSSRRNNG